MIIGLLRLIIIGNFRSCIILPKYLFKDFAGEEYHMSLIQKLFKGKIGHYSYDKEYLERTMEEERKHRYLKELYEISEKILAENPNYIDEVPKSKNGCWMEQMYGKCHCQICDFVDDCPIKLEEDWKAFLIEEAKQNGSQSPQENNTNHSGSSDAS